MDSTHTCILTFSTDSSTSTQKKVTDFLSNFFAPSTEEQLKTTKSYPKVFFKRKCKSLTSAETIQLFNDLRLLPDYATSHFYQEAENHVDVVLFEHEDDEFRKEADG